MYKENLEEIQMLLKLSAQEAEEFVNQVNYYLPKKTTSFEILYFLLGLSSFHRTPAITAWSILSRKRWVPVNNLPVPFLPARMPSIKERKAWVAGIAYENRQAICDKLQIGDSVFLRRELLNPYDIHAIAVDNMLGEKLGYLPRGEAFWCAYSLDVYGKPLEATVTSLHFVRGFRISKGVEIRYQLPIIVPTIGT